MCRTRTRASIATLILSVLLVGCGGDGNDPESTPTGPDAGADDIGGATTGAGADSAGEPATGSEAALRAITTAEDDTGGTAYAIDDRDDRSWEVDLAVDDRGLELTVSADGADVLGRDDDDLDDDDRAGLEQANIGLADAIVVALAEVDGTLDDAEISDDGGTFAWEVTIDPPDGPDLDVYVDVTTGEVRTVDRDD